MKAPYSFLAILLRILISLVLVAAVGSLPMVYAFGAISRFGMDDVPIEVKGIQLISPFLTIAIIILVAALFLFYEANRRWLRVFVVGLGLLPFLFIGSVVKDGEMDAYFEGERVLNGFGPGLWLLLSATLGMIPIGILSSFIRKPVQIPNDQLIDNN